MTPGKYIKAHYTVSIEVPKTPEEVFAVITEKVAVFWPEELTGRCDRQGEEFEFRTGDSHYSKNKVIEFEPPLKVTWLVTKSIRKPDNFDWSGTKMSFHLFPLGNGTRLTFGYEGPALETESERLQQICDLVIKERLQPLLLKR